MNNRSTLLAPVRDMINSVQSVCAGIRGMYPERYPVPPEIDAVLSLEDELIAKARGGRLNRVASIIGVDK
jgi:hypothetical protein